MNASLYDNVLATCYLILWVVTFLCYHWRNRRFDSGSCIIFFYILYAFVSILTLNDDFFSMIYEPLRIVPYIYLYGMLIIALTPMISLHNYPKVCAIEDPHTRILKIIAIAVILCGLLQLPFIVRSQSMNIMALFTDIDVAKESYAEQIEDAQYVGTGISNLFAIVYNAFYDLSIFVFFYFLTKKMRTWFIAIFLTTLVLGLLLPAIRGQRTAIVCGLQSFLVAYFLFKQFLSKRIRKIINWVGLSLIVLIMLPVMAITISRFNDRGIFRFVNWYVGQSSIYFNNYALNPGGIRHGDRTFSMFKRVVWSDTPKNFSERRDKYSNLDIDDYYFTTFVGDFVIDFGPYIAFVLFILFYGYIFWSIRPRGNIIKLSQLLLVYYAACVSMQGGMYLFSYSDTGNLKIAVFLIFYIYLEYHSRLLEKYPLQSKEQETTST